MSPCRAQACIDTAAPNLSPPRPKPSPFKTYRLGRQVQSRTSRRAARSSVLC